MKNPYMNLCSISFIIIDRYKDSQNYKHDEEGGKTGRAREKDDLKKEKKQVIVYYISFQKGFFKLVRISMKLGF